MGNGHQSSHPVVLIEYANAYNLFLSPASTTSPHACSSRLLLQVISLLHSPEALQHASTPACVTSTLHCSIIQQYHCVSSNVLHCTTLHCTALPVCLHTARRRQKEGEKRKKKNAACVSCPSHHHHQHPHQHRHSWQHMTPSPPVNLLFLFCQTRAAASSTALHLALLSPPTTCRRTSVAAELCSGWTDSLRAVSPW